jgi:hypothetical protein
MDLHFAPGLLTFVQMRGEISLQTFVHKNTHVRTRTWSESKGIVESF